MHGKNFKRVSFLILGPPSLLYNGYRSFPGVKLAGRDADHTHFSSAEVKKELIYTSTHPMGSSGPVTGLPLPLPFLNFLQSFVTRTINSFVFVYLFIYNFNDAFSTSEHKALNGIINERGENRILISQS